MTLPEFAAAISAAMLVTAAVLFGHGVRRRAMAISAPRPPRRRRRARTARPQQRRRLVVGSAVGIALWALTGWPAAGAAVVAAVVWLPWLLGSAAITRDRIATSEALERWCRRMADTLSGGGAIGLAQAVVATAGRVDEPIAAAVGDLTQRVQLDTVPMRVALREFADAVDDRTGDAVAAALLLALQQQSVGVASVLRQLGDGIARDVRARRDIEAARAESRQSMRMLLIIQAGLLALLAMTPGFSAPYDTPVGQVVMVVLLAATAGLLVWMRRLALGRPAPRFLGTIGGPR